VGSFGSRPEEEDLDLVNHVIASKSPKQVTTPYAFALDGLVVPLSTDREGLVYTESLSPAADFK
jgi:hypothetical protein